MRNGRMLPATAAVMMLAGCGGGGGGTGSAGSSAPPTNTTLTNLKASQTFANDATATTVSYDLTTKTVITGTAATDGLTISYDAATQSYTLSAPGRSQTFTPADIATSNTNGTTVAANETKYQKTDGTNRDYLTLVKSPYTSAQKLQYVGLGFWQRNLVTGSQQNTSFDSFTYGLATPATAVPRTGTAGFGIDVFGLNSLPGQEPTEFQGHGSLTLDFAAGIFSASADLTENGLVTGRSETGGIQLQAAGHLAGSDGTFAGNMLYGPSNGSHIAGTLSGRLYGPGAEELGASFSGSNASGAAVNGSLTGQRDTSIPAANLRLTSLVTSQLFYTQGTRLTYISFDGNVSPPQVRTMDDPSDLNRQNSDTFTLSGDTSLPGGQFTATDAVASNDPLFQSYDKTSNGQDVRLDLYKIGSANSELALTYLSFGRRSSSSHAGVTSETDRSFFVYGLQTPGQLLSARTGSAHYAGVAYGAGGDQTTGTQYDIKGTSAFDIDFSHQSYTGALALKGTPTTGAAAVDFGSFTFAGHLASYGDANTADLMQGGTASGSITHRFYGPDGEEIGGPFTTSARDAAGRVNATIAGVAVAKR